MAINDKTAVSLSVVAVLISGIVWLSTVFAQVRHNGRDIDELKVKTTRSVEVMESIDRRLSRIEGKLNIQPLGK